MAVVDFENNEVKNIEVDFAYLPMWSNNEALPKVLTELIENICPIDEIDAVGISMTAELVDAYDTKKDGVLDVVKKCPILEGVDKEYFYFVHSYHVVPDNDEIIAGTCDYGIDVVAALSRNNLFSTQFHPEKSGVAGLKILKNFVNLEL